MGGVPSFLWRHKYKLTAATVVGVGAGVYFGSDKLAAEAQSMAMRMIEQKQIEERYVLSLPYSSNSDLNSRTQAEQAV